MQSLAFKRQNLLAYASNNCSIKPAIPKHGPCGSTDTFLLPLSNPWSSKRLGLTLTDTRGSRNLAGYHKKRQDRMASTQDGGIESAQQTQAGPPKTDEQHLTSTAI